MADGELRRSVELSAFFADLALLMRLPRKMTGKDGGAAGDAGSEPAPGRAGRSRHTAAWVSLALVAIMVLYLVFKPVETTLPAALEGVWRTNAAAYADRSLEITPTSLSFRASDSTAAGTRHRITRVRRSALPDGTLFHVEYLQDGSQLEFSFVWRGSEIQFANQKDLIWTRRGPADSGGSRGRPGT